MKAKLFRECPGALFALLLVTGVAMISGCGRKPGAETASAEAEQALDAGVTPEERPYFDAAKPFAEAIAARDYSKAYGYFSSHAKARMSPNQFVAPADDAVHKKNEAAAVQNVGLDQFARMLSATEAEYGKPAKLEELHVFSTDPVALSGNGKSVEQKLDTMFAIGMMPASIPVAIRKASLRSKLIVELGQEQLAQAAKDYQTTPEKLKANPDFQPYVTLKMVLVEDAGALKIGYFEFVPPGIFD
jgi:hypothetical protein